MSAGKGAPQQTSKHTVEEYSSREERGKNRKNGLDEESRQRGDRAGGTDKDGDQPNTTRQHTVRSGRVAPKRTIMHSAGSTCSGEPETAKITWKERGRTRGRAGRTECIIRRTHEQLDSENTNTRQMHASQSTTLKMHLVRQADFSALAHPVKR